jgi:hypothetical protein
VRVLSFTHSSYLSEGLPAPRSLIPAANTIWPARIIGLSNPLLEPDPALPPPVGYSRDLPHKQLTKGCDLILLSFPGDLLLVAWSLHWIERSFVGRFFRPPTLRFGLPALVLSPTPLFSLLCDLLNLLLFAIDHCEGGRRKLLSPPWRPMHQRLQHHLPPTVTRGDH